MITIEFSIVILMIKIASDLIKNPNRFRPTQIITSFRQLPFLLKMKNAHLVIFDKDDTLTSLHQFQIHQPQIKEAINRLKEMRLKMFILSNSIKDGDPLKVQQIQILRTLQKKPFNQGEIRSIIGGTQLSKVWIIGDRLMTDIYLANKIGCRSILVPPIQPTSIDKHGVLVYTLRNLENSLISLKKWK